jgi:hypothetical protein
MEAIQRQIGTYDSFDSGIRKHIPFEKGKWMERMGTKTRFAFVRLL